MLLNFNATPNDKNIQQNSSHKELVLFTYFTGLITYEKLLPGMVCGKSDKILVNNSRKADCFLQ